MKILKENTVRRSNVQHSKVLKESAGVNPSESIDDIIVKSILRPACDYFNSIFREDGFEFSVFEETGGSKFIVIDKIAEEEISLACIMDVYADEDVPWILYLTLVEWNSDKALCQANNFKEMAEFLKKEINNIPEME